MLADGTLVMDSRDAAAGFDALRNAAPEREAVLTSAVQRAWFQEGKSLSDPATYAAIADDLGLDSDAVAASQDALNQHLGDFATAAEVGSTSARPCCSPSTASPAASAAPSSSAHLLQQFDSAVAASA